MQSKIRALASDTLVYGLSTTISRFLSFLLTPLYTNYMSRSENGDVTNMYAAIAFINILFTLGMEPAFMRFWRKDDDNAAKQAFSGAFVSIVVLCMLMTSLLMVFAGQVAESSLLKLPTDGAYLLRLAAIIPLVDAMVLIPFALLRMQRQSKKFALFRLATVVINVAANVVFVVILGWRVEGVMIAGIISSVATLVLMIPMIIKNLQLPVSFRLIREMFGFGLPTVPSTFSANVVQVADRPIMTSLLNSAAVGVYQTNYKLGIPMMLFVSVFETAWRPFFMQQDDSEESRRTFSRVLTLFTVASGLIFLITSLFIPYIVNIPFVGGKFINPSYWYALPIVPVVLFAFYFSGISTNLAAGLYITKNTRLLPLATGASAIVNVAGTLLLVPMYGMIGAAWAKVAAFAIGAAIMAWMQHRVFSVKYDVSNIVYTVLVCAGLYVLVLQIPEQSPWSVVARIVSLPLFIALLIVKGVLGLQSVNLLKRLTRRGG